VREVLCQPKYTGYMVWNRRAMKTRGGSPNPLEEWVWSSRPSHEAIVDLDTFVAAQKVAQRRERSRTAAEPNPHPHTKRSYLLRSHLFCALCGRRMFGKTRRGHAYYACAPRKGQDVPDGHPASLWVNEGALVDAFHDFLSQHVFGDNRRALLADTMTELDQAQRDEHTRRITATEKAIADVELSRRRLIRVLEVADDPDPDLLRDISDCRAELAVQHSELTTELRQLVDHVHQQPNQDLIGHLPVGPATSPHYLKP
jgi:site-specific DNA recombinase